MGAFQNIIVSGADVAQFDNAFCFSFIFIEQVKEQFGISNLEVVVGLFNFVGVEYVTIGYAIYPFNVVNVFNALDIHSQTFQTVGNFYSNRFYVKATNLLEVGELGNFHTVQPNFPTQAPSAQGGRFPVIFYKADVMFFLTNAKFSQALEIQVLDIFRRGFHDYLVLVMLEQTVRVVTITTVSRTTGRFNISDVPRFRTKYTQEGGGVHSARTFFYVIGLTNNAILFSPEVLQLQNHCLQIHSVPPI